MRTKSNQTQGTPGVAEQQVVVLRPENVTANAQKICCNWLAFCLTLGWKKESLDALEQMWWDWHDRKGKFKQHNAELSRAGDEPKM